VVKSDGELKSPWFRPQSKQFCVSLHYYTHTNGRTESTTAKFHVEYKDRKGKIYEKNLEPSEVSIYFEHSLSLNLVKRREDNLNNTIGVQVLHGDKL
jgi:hypothetical protein